MPWPPTWSLTALPTSEFRPNLAAVNAARVGGGRCCRQPGSRRQTCCRHRCLKSHFARHSCHCSALVDGGSTLSVVLTPTSELADVTVPLKPVLPLPQVTAPLPPPHVAAQIEAVVPSAGELRPAIVIGSAAMRCSRSAHPGSPLWQGEEATAGCSKSSCGVVTTMLPFFTRVAWTPCLSPAVGVGSARSR